MHGNVLPMHGFQLVSSLEGMGSSKHIKSGIGSPKPAPPALAWISLEEVLGNTSGDRGANSRAVSTAQQACMM
jgi:hypothetical protein